MPKAMNEYRTPPRSLSQSRTLLPIALAAALVASGCSSTTDPVEATAAPTEVVGDDSVRVWADELVDLMATAGEDLSNLRPGGELSEFSPTVPLEQLVGSAALIAGLESSLTDAPEASELMTGRYQEFRDALASYVSTADASATPPEDDSPWALGAALDEVATAGDDFLNECFALQELFTENSLGVLDCTALSGVERWAASFYADQASEGPTIFAQMEGSLNAQLGVGAPAVDVSHESCRIPTLEVDLSEINRFAAAGEALTVDSPSGSGSQVVETWVFADRAAATLVVDTFNQYVRSRKDCLVDAAYVRLGITGLDGTASYEPLPSGQVTGFLATDIPATNVDDAYVQIGVAMARNVVAVYSGAGTGRPVEQSDIDDLVGTALLGGDRPA